MKTWVWPAVLVLVLAGGSTVDDEKPTPDSSVSTSSNVDEVFLARTSAATFRLAGLELAGADLIKVGRITCSGFSDGLGWADAKAVLTDREMTSSQADALLAASIEAYCPEHQALAPTP